MKKSVFGSEIATLRRSSHKKRLATVSKPSEEVRSGFEPLYEVLQTSA